MAVKSYHSFHIPVMGLGFTVDTPLKVARYGINSVVSIIQDVLLEQMREFHSRSSNKPFLPITEHSLDKRALRVTAYLDLLNEIVDEQVTKLKLSSFIPGSEITNYYELLPDDIPVKNMYLRMLNSKGDERLQLEKILRDSVVPGSIDVNIMTRIDKPSEDQDGKVLPYEYSDAAAALRGYARSKLSSSLVFSAGLNPRLFGYLASFEDFFPDKHGQIKKKIILKVSDLRSARIQAKYLAGKGLWVSEFRLESGLNCGGHAFPTQGFLLGPILEEFKNEAKKVEEEIRSHCNSVLTKLGRPLIPEQLSIELSVQGGIGSFEETELLKKYYQFDTTGWGSPFLLVPEATNLDQGTLKALSTASPDQYFVSHASPLGIPFNNFSMSTSQSSRKKRIVEGRPGSPCYLKYLTFNTEFTEKPICVSSREYQFRKIKELEASSIDENTKQLKIAEVEDKECLCEGLSSSALLKNAIPVRHGLNAVAVCPGPNLAYFSGVFSLKEMVNHIYGRLNLLNAVPRPHMFIKELEMYISYFNKLIESFDAEPDKKKADDLSRFRSNILEGVHYYQELINAKVAKAFGKWSVNDLELLVGKLQRVPELVG